MTGTQRRLLALAICVRKGFMPLEQAATALEALSARPVVGTPAGFRGAVAETILAPGARAMSASEDSLMPIGELIPGVWSKLAASETRQLESEFDDLERDPPRAIQVMERSGLDAAIWKPLWGLGLKPKTGPGSTAIVAPSTSSPVGRSSTPPPISVKGELPSESHGTNKDSRYELKRELARGGMGRVFIAVDKTVGREVAIKEMLTPVTRAIRATQVPGSTSAYGELERFLREARITGQLEHPNIVPVYEIGEKEDGSVFYSMKLVRGESMADRLRDIQRKPGLTAGERLAERLKMLDGFVDACQAIAYAHSRGVINRDLKPSNIMLGDFGETLVLDWGLARVKGQDDKARKDLINATAMMTKAAPVDSKPDSTKLTIDGSVLGTPSYMPPEQARGELDEIDERSDVYSLGAILYELVTGIAPFEGPSAEMVLRSVIHLEPVWPTALDKHAPRELEAILKHALAKNKSQRLDSSKRLAEEVQAFRDGRSVSLYQYTAFEQVARFVKRNRALTVLFFGLIVAMVAGTIASLSYARIARDQSAEARSAESDARKAESAAKKARDAAEAAATRAEGLRLAATAKPLAADNAGAALLLAIEAAKRAPGVDSNNAIYAALFHLNERSKLIGHEHNVISGRFSPDGRTVATGGGDATVRLWDPMTGKEQKRFDDSREAILQVEWSPDGKRLAAREESGGVRVYEVERGLPLAVLKGHAGDVFGIAWRPGGSSQILTWSRDGSARLWQAATGDSVELKSSGKPVVSCEFSADGQSLATATDDGDVRVWDATGKERLRLATKGSTPVVRWSADGKRLVTAEGDGGARTWDASTGSEMSRVAKWGERPVVDVAFSQDGTQVAVRCDDSITRVFDAGFKEKVREFLSIGLSTNVLTPDWSYALRPSGYWLDVYETATGRLVSHLGGHEYDILGFSYSPDHRWIVTCGKDRMAFVWSALPGQLFPRLASPPEGVRTGNLTTVFCAAEKSIRVFDLMTGSTARTLPMDPAEFRGIALSPEGKLFCCIYAGSDRLDFFDPETGKKVGTVKAGVVIDDVRWSISGGAVAVALPDRRFRTWRVSRVEAEVTIEEVGTITLADPEVQRWTISPDGAWLVTGNGSRQDLRLYDMAAGMARRRFLGHTGHVLDVFFCPDGKHFVSSAADASARYWSIDSDKPIGYYRIPVIQEFTPIVSPAGRFFSVTVGGVAHIVECGAGQMTDYAALPSDLPLWGIEFTRDGKSFVVSDPAGRRLVPLDALAAARDAAPRELTAAEIGRWEVLRGEDQDAAKKAYFERHPSQMLLIVQGMDALRDNKVENAIGLFRKSIPILPNFPNPWIHLAVGLAARAGELDAADPARAAVLSEAISSVAKTIECGEPAEEVHNDLAYLQNRYPHLKILETLSADPRFEVLFQEKPR